MVTFVFQEAALRIALLSRCCKPIAEAVENVVILSELLFNPLARGNEES